MKRALTVLLVLSFFPAAAHAADNWTDPFPGVRRLYRTTSGPNWRIHAMVIDLCAEGISFRATKSSERGRTTSSFGQLVGAQIAINGDFFSAGYATSGMAVGDGERWTNDNSARGWVGMGPGYVKISTPADGVDQPGWVNDSVGGNIMVLKDGVVTGDTGSFCTTRHPRTVAGLSADGMTLYLAVVDGRQTASVGMTCAELGNLMKGLGADDALNLDGGGSSTIWMAGSGVLNSPSDGSQRTVANHLGVYASGSGEPEACMKYEAELVAEYIGLDDFYKGGSSDGVPDVLVGDEFQGALSLTSRTPRRWRGTKMDYWFEPGFLAATNYVIESDHPVYDRMTWTVNSANDAPENPAKNAMGDAGSLVMHAYTTNETKRVTLDLRALEYSIGAVDHPDARAWLHHIDDVYGEQADFFEEPTNGNRFGVNVRDFAQLDVLSPYEWQFEDGGNEGWGACGDGIVVPVEGGAILLDGCISSPDWTLVDASRFDQAVVRLAAPLESLAIGIGDDLVEFEGLVAGDNVLDLAGTAWAGQIQAFNLQGNGAIDGLWFQSSADNSSSSGSEVFVSSTPFEPIGVVDNPNPIDPGNHTGGGGNNGTGVPGGNGGTNATNGGPMMMDDTTVTAEGGCCAVASPRPIRWPGLVALMLVVVGLRRGSRRASSFESV